MKISRLSLFVLSFFICSCNVKNNKQSDALLDGFSDPPKNAKPKGYWCLVNGNFDLTKMRKELREFKEKGTGTLDIWDVAGWVDENKVVPAGPPFMSDKSVQAIAHAIREAGKLDIDIGLTISSSWNAGGEWIEPEDGVMGLFTSSIKVSGEKQIDTQIPFPDIPDYYDARRKNILYKDKNGLPTFYKEVAVLAYKYENDSLITEIMNLSDEFINGRLNWNVPSGNWEITRFVCTGTGQPLMNPSPNSNGLMIDHFSERAMKRHMNFFFDKLENELGDLSETALKYLYTDSYEANSAVWTVKMPEEFEHRAGYKLDEYLPILLGFKISNDDVTGRFLFDFRKVLSDLIIENHYELGREMCEDKGIEFIAEAGGPGPPIHNCPFESLSSLGKLSAPRGEFWFEPMWSEERINELQIVKGPASAAHLYNRPRVEAEAFTGLQLWQFGPGDLKSTADRAMCEGLTSFVYHTSPHIPREAGIPGWVYNFGTIINTTVAWWPLSSSFHNYLGRSCFMLQQGNFVGDVLYYYGDEAPNFVKPKRLDPSLGFGYDYDVVNSDIILNHLDVKNGCYILPHGQEYKILVLPDTPAMNPDVLKKIAELVKKGGVIVGDSPSKSLSLFQKDKNDAEVKNLAGELWKINDSQNEYGSGLVFNNERTLREILNELEIYPDLMIERSEPEKCIDFIHRKTSDTDIYFIRNVTDTEQVFNVSVRSIIGDPELWNPENMEISTVPTFEKDNSFTKLPLKLNGYGSVFIVLRKGSKNDRVDKIVKDDDQVYPLNNNYFPISFSNKGILFEENGHYNIEYVNGSVQNLAVSDIMQKLIDGDWELRFPFGWGAPQRIKTDQLKSWTEFSDKWIKYFSGIAEYHKTFEIGNIAENHEYYIDLGKVSKVARLYINGHDAGKRWFSPFVFNITDYLKQGKNHLVIEIANVMSNQMVGDSYREGRDKRTHSNITRGPHAWMTEYQKLDLIESGLLGPVKIFSKAVL